MTQNKWQYFIVSAAIPVALLCSCDKHDRPLPQGAYRVSVEEISSWPTSITRRYEIETSSRRTLALAEMAGSNSASIAPDMMTEERTGKAHVTVTVALQEEGEMFCASTTLSFAYVLEFSTARKEKLNVQKEVFHA